MNNPETNTEQGNDNSSNSKAEPQWSTVPPVSPSAAPHETPLSASPLPAIVPPTQHTPIPLPSPVHKAFPKALNWIALLPVLGMIMLFGVREETFPVALTFLVVLIAFVGIIYLYIRQITYMRRVLPDKNLRPQYVIEIGAPVLAVVASAIGDVSGAVTYSNSIEGVSGWTFGGGLGLGLGVFFMYMSVLQNMLTISSNGGSNGLKVVGRIFYGLGWMIIAVISYLAYVIAYTAHDPSSE